MPPAPRPRSARRFVGSSASLPSLAPLRAALRREARRIVPGIPPLAAFLETFLPAASLRRAALTYALGRALGTPARLLRPPALAVELVHAATLLHDDLLDADPVRRALPAAWRAYGPHPAVLLGDALLCRALSLLAASPRADLLPALARSATLVCRGELLQDFPSLQKPASRARFTSPQSGRASQARKAGAPLPPPPESPTPNSRNTLKTSPLFSFAALSAAPPGSPPALLRALSLAGTRLGTLYQRLDDLRDAPRPPSALPPSSILTALRPLLPHPPLHSAALSWTKCFLS